MGEVICWCEDYFARDWFSVMIGLQGPLMRSIDVNFDKVAKVEKNLR